jgi:hypothetical protein
MTTTTIDQQIRDVGREIAMRRSCYPRWVASGKMIQAQADHQIACMSDVYEMLKLLKETGGVYLADAPKP